MLADELDFVIGVDTHRDSHSLALVSSPAGARLTETQVQADEEGYAAALAFACEHAQGNRAWAIEGTGSYGKGLTRHLERSGELVIEVERPRRRSKREQGKSDSIDALKAARFLLAKEKPVVPRSAGPREALRVLLQVRTSALAARKVALAQLRALLVTCPEPLRGELRSLTRARLLNRLRSLRMKPGREHELASTLLALKLLARRIEALSLEIELCDREILPLAREMAPRLLAERGVGPICAAQALVSWSHPGRFRSEAAFARLAGVPPIPASSGQTVRWRLDRGGDRKLNCALHMIVLSRRQHDPETISYIERRVREGKSEREAVRCLKRYLARRLFRLLEESALTA